MDKEIFNKYLYDYIHLLSSYLNNEKLDDMDIDDKRLSFYIKLSKFHSLSALLYKAIVDTGIKINKEYLPRLEEAYLSNVRKIVLFDKERNELYKYLNDNKIDYLPLKGIIIKDYYPDPATREFADNDILFNPKGTKLVKKFFLSHGYKVEAYRRTNHDVYVKKPFYNFEMHRELFVYSKEKEKIYSYFEHCLFNSPVRHYFEHFLKQEDFYVYFTSHAYKHFNSSGVGFRTLIDFYLFYKNNKLNLEYINNELSKLDIKDFSNKMLNLSLKIFDGKNLNTEESGMFLYIASSGTQGTVNQEVEKGISKKGKTGYIFSRLFPSTDYYKTTYPWAYKYKILIPIPWFLRLCRGLFKHHKKTIQELKEVRKHKKNK